ncbi:MAG: geranylgeranylglycerol-phosphate geranylgeranyltransferase [Crocinitomicaceae bacterium]|nr:geranylgeranylglycerol-phosphate geranylgeranyltransferase [Crocinitomicaceae bacterium]
MHFIRLIRPINLLIIALTMYGLGWYFDTCISDGGVNSFTFFILVLSTIIIAAAGNIINDYFDVRADRINKPDRMVIEKHIKKRVAIVTHWGFNFIAFSMAIYLTWKTGSFWYAFIHLFSINVLWLYSLYFKRQFLIGNLLIAALTALVTILVGIYFYQINNISSHELGTIYPFENIHNSFSIIWISLGLALFAFLLNFAREIVKDIEDVKGDLELKSRTIPIVLGTIKSKRIVAFILAIVILSALFVWNQYQLSFNSMILIGVSALTTTIALILLFQSTERKHYRLVNHLIKLSMTAGLLTPIYWKLIAIYG